MHISFNRATPPRNWYRAIWEWVRVRLLRKAPRYARIVSREGTVLTVTALPVYAASGEPIYPASKVNWYKEVYCKVDGTTVKIPPFEVPSVVPDQSKGIAGLMENAAAEQDMVGRVYGADPDWPEVIGE